MRRILRVLTLAVACFSMAFSLVSCGARWHTVRLYAMGTACTLTVSLPYGEDGDGTPLFASLLSETEALLSHESTSSVAHLLNTAGEARVEDAALWETLRLAEELRAKTGGLFSVSVLPVSSLWDFGAEDPTPPSDDAVSTALAEMRESELSFENGTVKRTGGTVDLGAVGKGYACDVISSALREQGKEGLVAVGGSLAAVGTKAGAPWQVGVRDPFSPTQTKTLGTLSLQNAFVSTSGSYEKCFTYEGKDYHHILDPHTGMPAESDLRSVTVVAYGGALSDMLSTACFLVGSDAAFSLAAEYGASLVAVKTDGTLLVSGSLKDTFEPSAGFTPVYR